MLVKDYQLQKIDDVARGYGELFRTEHVKMLSYNLLREITTSSDTEAEFVLEQLKLNQRLDHPSLLKIVAFDYKYCIEEGEKPEQDVRYLLNLLKSGEAKNPVFAQRKASWKIRVMLENCKHTLAQEVQLRAEQGVHFSLAYLQNFLRSLVDLLASLQHNEFGVRDVCPLNLFVPAVECGEGEVLLGDANEFLKYLRNERSAEAFTASRCFKFDYLLYACPRLFNAVLAHNFRARADQYRSAVFSLGLVALHLATLADVRGLNVNAEQTRKLLKGLFAQVEDRFGRELKLLLRKMLTFDEAARPDCCALDEGAELRAFLAVDAELQELSVRGDDESAKIQTHFYGARADGKIRRQRLFDFAGVDKCAELLFSQPKLQNLERLEFQFTPLSADAVQRLAQLSLPHLRELCVSGAHEFSPEELRALLAPQSLPQLRRLHLSMVGLTPQCVLELCRWPGLQRLKALDLSSNQRLGDDGLDALLAHYPKDNRLRELNLGGANKGCRLSDNAVLALGQNLETSFPHLRVLDLSWNKLFVESLMYVITDARFVRLDKLILKRTYIVTDDLRFSMKQKHLLKNVELE